MISYLRQEMDKNKKGHERSTWSTANQSSIMFYNNISQIGLNNSNIIIDAPKVSKY